MKKVTAIMKITAMTAVVILSCSTANAVRWGGGVGFNQVYAPGFGSIGCVGNYATSPAALTAAHSAAGGFGSNYGGGTWSATGYGVAGRGFNSTQTDVIILHGGGYATSAAAVSAAYASLAPSYSYNKLAKTAYNP
jgi:hypothetical protein